MATRKPFDGDPDRRISLWRQRTPTSAPTRAKRIAQTIRLRPERREEYLRHHDVLFAHFEYDGDDFEIWHLGDPDTESPS